MIKFYTTESQALERVAQLLDMPGEVSRESIAMYAKQQASQHRHICIGFSNLAIAVMDENVAPPYTYTNVILATRLIREGTDIWAVLHTPLDPGKEWAKSNDFFGAPMMSLLARLTWMACAEAFGYGEGFEDSETLLPTEEAK